MSFIETNIKLFEKMSLLTELFTERTINRSTYNDILGSIISGRTHPILSEYGELKDIRATYVEKINEKIESMLTTPETDRVKKAIYVGPDASFEIANEHFAKRVSNISTWVVFNCKYQGEINFGILGSDLRSFISLLPKYVDCKTNRILRPFTLSDFTKIYPSFLRNLFVTITVNLMLFDNLVNRGQIFVVEQFTKREFGQLGSEVQIEIPPDFAHLTKYFNFRSLTHQHNPRKMSEGLYNFNKNGVTHIVANKLIREIIKYKSQISDQDNIFDNYIVAYDISDFLASDKQIAVCAWDKHARIIVKSKFDANEIVIIDSWMKYIPRKVGIELKKSHPNIKFTMLWRNIQDQTNEGSCVLCSMARLLNIAFEYNGNNLAELCDIPIKDINAFLIARMYRTCMGQMY
jgi:hypothetical protein